MSAPDYAEAIHGWRVWRVVATRDGLRLWSVIYDEVWEPRSEFRAGCACATHDAPAPDCGCGVHAARSADAVARHLLGRNDADVVHRVLGTVALWGRVYEGEHGWRGANAYPVRLVVPEAPRAAEVASGLRVYGVEVELLPAARAAQAAQGPVGTGAFDAESARRTIAAGTP